MDLARSPYLLEVRMIRKIGRFAFWVVVLVPYLAVVAGADLLRDLWKEAAQ